MSMPLFQEATRGQPYIPPDYDQVEQEQDRVDSKIINNTKSTYVPAPVSLTEMSEIHRDMRLNRVPINKTTEAHALEAEEIRKMLRRVGIDSMRKVSATKDSQGIVRMTFDDFRTLVESLLKVRSA